MFGFKIIRRSKQDEKDALTYRGIVIDIYEEINKVIDKLSSTIALGDMEFSHKIGEHIKKIDSLLSLYNMNKFSSPSAFLVMTDFMKGLIKQYKVFIDIQTKMKNLTYDVLKYHNMLQIYPERFNKEYDDELKHKTEVLCNDSENAISIIVPEMRSLLVALRTAITPEKEAIIHDVDIIDDYYKRKKMKTDGTKYQISFKMVNKAEGSQNSNTTKEENRNVLQKEKETD